MRDAQKMVWLSPEEYQELQDDFVADPHSAFQRLFDAYYPKLYVFIVNTARRDDDTKDILSQTFYKAYTCAVTFNPALGKLSTWLYTIAKNEMLQMFRREKRYDACDIIVFHDPDNGLDETRSRFRRFAGLDSNLNYAIREWTNQEYCDHVWPRKDDQTVKMEVAELTLESMPAMYSTPLREFVYGRSYKQIARHHNLTLNTVKTRILRARRIVNDAYQMRHNNITKNTLITYNGEDMKIKKLAAVLSTELNCPDYQTIMRKLMLGESIKKIKDHYIKFMEKRDGIVWFQEKQKTDKETIRKMRELLKKFRREEREEREEEKRRGT